MHESICSKSVGSGTVIALYNDTMFARWWKSSEVSWTCRQLMKNAEQSHWREERLIHNITNRIKNKVRVDELDKLTIRLQGPYVNELKNPKTLCLQITVQKQILVSFYNWKKEKEKHCIGDFKRCVKQVADGLP